MPIKGVFGGNTFFFFFSATTVPITATVCPGRHGHARLDLAIDVGCAHRRVTRRSALVFLVSSPVLSAFLAQTLLVSYPPRSVPS